MTPGSSPSPDQMPCQPPTLSEWSLAFSPEAPYLCLCSSPSTARSPNVTEGLPCLCFVPPGILFSTRETLLLFRAQAPQPLAAMPRLPEAAMSTPAASGTCHLPRGLGPLLPLLPHLQNGLGHTAASSVTGVNQGPLPGLLCGGHESVSGKFLGQCLAVSWHSLLVSGFCPQCTQKQARHLLASSNQILSTTGKARHRVCLLSLKQRPAEVFCRTETFTQDSLTPQLYALTWRLQKLPVCVAVVGPLDGPSWAPSGKELIPGVGPYPAYQAHRGQGHGGPEPC